MGRYSYKSSERAERKRAAELARLQKERAKQSELEAAKEAVEAFEARVAEVKSVHRQCTEPVNWASFASALPPCVPMPVDYRQKLAGRLHRVLVPLGVDDHRLPDIVGAAKADATELEQQEADWRQETIEHEEMSGLAQAVLRKDVGAYLTALRSCPGLSELTERGSNLEIFVASPTLVVCTFTPLSSAVIPNEVSTLTASGKLSTKPMNRTQFIELYQDFVCSCVLRIAREVFAVLPVANVLVTAMCADGNSPALPVLSVVLDRVRVTSLPFDSLDPSDSVETFTCRTDFKASRKSDAFRKIVPFQVEDIAPPPQSAQLAELLKHARVLLDELE